MVNSHTGYKYQIGTIHAGMKVVSHNGRSITVVCTGCQQLREYDVTSLRRIVVQGKTLCNWCRTRRTDENMVIELAIWDAKTKGESRGHVWQLTFDEAKNMFLSDCHYCGSPPSSKRFFKSSWHAKVLVNGIDRKNNAEGYTAKNSVPCCGICNRAKSSMKYEDFIAYIDRIRNAR